MVTGAAFVCWAGALGNCAGGPSREHIVSKSQFDDDKITVLGLPWCKEPKTVRGGVRTRNQTFSFRTATVRIEAARELDLGTFRTPIDHAIDQPDEGGR